MMRRREASGGESGAWAAAAAVVAEAAAAAVLGSLALGAVGMHCLMAARNARFLHAGASEKYSNLHSRQS
jgi:hypothetical protein